jgi:[CysO sulfur-carrier protein]-S-L-cysteine hydrolase
MPGGNGAVPMADRFDLEVPVSIYDDLVAQARSEVPVECCGLLAGRLPAFDSKPARAKVERRYPLVNELQSPREFLSESRSMFDAMRDMERRGLEVLAVYHSHPQSPPTPSRKDLEWSYSSQVVHLILSLATATPELRGWWLEQDRFEEAFWKLVEG